jgi:ribonuclease HII
LTTDFFFLDNRSVIDIIGKSDSQTGTNLNSQVHNSMAQTSANLLSLENKLWNQGFREVAGVDEAGRGPLAGPVVAACVILPKDFCVPDVNDSKKLTAKKRERLFDEIIQSGCRVGVGIVTEKVIDKLNILNASLQAMHQAVNQLKYPPDFVLVDGNQRIPDLPFPQMPVVKGDSLSLSIAAASIVAKVTRDRMMLEYHVKYPEFNFADHKGYATRTHVEALKTFGPCQIHRRSFKLVRLCRSNQTDMEMK